MTWAMRLNGGQLVEDGKSVPYYPEGFRVNVIRDGTGFGNPEPLTKAINSLMTQGSWEVVERFGNRAPAIVVEIAGDTSDALNAGEMWLSSLMGAGSLEWLPPGQYVWTVFDVVSCYILRSEDERWDLDEHQWKRRYLIPIQALPYARSQNLTTTFADAVVGDVVLSDGSNTTGWSASWYRDFPPYTTTATAVSVVSGAVRATRNTAGETDDNYLSLRFALPSTPSPTTPYLRADRRSVGSPSVMTATTNIGPLPVAAIVLTAGTYACYYLLPDGAHWVDFTTQFFPAQDAYAEVDQVRLTAYLPASSTSRQKNTAITPGGSAPAEGSLEISSATAASLGTTIVYSYPLGRPSPALMSHRTYPASGTADTDTLNGTRYPLHPDLVRIEVEAGQIPKRGLVALWAKVRCDTDPATLLWNVSTTMGGALVRSMGDQTRPIASSSSWQAVPLGLVHLPVAETGANGTLQIELSRSAGTGLLWLDEVWAFGIDDESALTIQDCGTGAPAAGGPASKLWIDAPSAELPAGRILIGTQRSDARTPPIGGVQQVHRFPAGGVSVLVAAFKSEPMLTLRHYRRWTHHAGS